MMFRFNFNNTSDCEIDENQSSEYADESSIEYDDRLCDFLDLTNKNFENTYENMSSFKFEQFGEQCAFIHSSLLKSMREKNNELYSLANSLQTDLIPGKYEGGLKVWECSTDLMTYIIENNCIKAGCTVLELGCGAGLPGLMAYRNGASVTFQDFNPEVLEHTTLPNVVMGTEKEKLARIPELCSFLHGDWGHIKKKFYENTECPKNWRYYDEPFIWKIVLSGTCLALAILDKRFDVILTAETIYSKENQKKLLELMKCSLKPDGIIYLAAKIHYFGVGGGILDFENLVNSDKSFEIIQVHRITDEGVERQILVMKFRQQKGNDHSFTE